MTEFGMQPGQDPGPLPNRWVVTMQFSVSVPYDERVRQDLIDAYNRADRNKVGTPTYTMDDFIDSDTGEFDASEFGFWILNNRMVPEFDDYVTEVDYEVDDA